MDSIREGWGEWEYLADPKIPFLSGDSDPTVPFGEDKHVKS